MTKEKGPVKKFLSVTLGPTALIKQSFGSQTGSTVKTQYQSWKAANDLNLKDVISNRASFDFEKRCYDNRRKPGDVRSAYRNVAIIQGVLWIGIAVTTAGALAKSGTLLSVIFTVMAMAALPVMLLSATHHQICIREKVFLSPKELFRRLMKGPGLLFPSSLPEEWKLYTRSKAEMEGLKGGQNIKLKVKRKGH